MIYEIEGHIQFSAWLQRPENAHLLHRAQVRARLRFWALQEKGERLSEAVRKTHNWIHAWEKRQRAKSKCFDAVDAPMFGRTAGDQAPNFARPPESNLEKVHRLNSEAEAERIERTAAKWEGTGTHTYRVSRKTQKKRRRVRQTRTVAEGKPTWLAAANLSTSR